MADSIKKELYTMRRYDLTGSMKQSVSPFLMDDSEFTYLKNVSYDEIGSLSKDGGFSQFGLDVDTSGKGDLIHSYLDSVNTYTLLAVTNGSLFRANGDVWAAIDTTTFTADEPCTAVNRGGYAYIVNGLDGLYYTDGSTLTSVASDNGGSDIKGKYITALNNELYLANLLGTHESNDVVHTVGGGNTFYVPSEEGHDTYATTNNKFSANEAITGITAFQGTIIYFTENEMYMYNPSNAEVKVIARIGCVSHNTIKEINSVLYWANRDGVYRFNGEDSPELISIPITNWAINSLWRLISGSSWTTLAAVDFEGKYMLAVGDLSASLPGDDGAISDAVIVYDTYRDVWYFLDNYPVAQWTRFVNADGNLRLMFISKDEPAVMRKDYTYQSDGAAVDMVVRTKYFNFDMPENEKVLENLLVTCRASDADGYYMDVKLAINGTNNYESYITSATETKVELDGVSGIDFQLDRVTVKGVRARTVSYEFSNDDSGVNMILLGFTQQYRYLNNNMNFSV